LLSFTYDEITALDGLKPLVKSLLFASVLHLARHRRSSPRRKLASEITVGSFSLRREHTQEDIHIKGKKKHSQLQHTNTLGHDSDSELTGKGLLRPTLATSKFAQGQATKRQRSARPDQRNPRQDSKAHLPAGQGPLAKKDVALDTEGKDKEKEDEKEGAPKRSAHPSKLVKGPAAAKTTKGFEESLSRPKKNTSTKHAY
jgi:hypothetical protein